MQVPTELITAIVGGFVGALAPVTLSYVETVRRGAQLRYYLAKEIEFNGRILFEYGSIWDDIGVRIIWPEDFRFEAWESAIQFNFLFLSRYEMIYVTQIYEDARHIEHLTKHVEVYKDGSETASYKWEHVVSQIGFYCGTSYTSTGGARPIRLAQSLERKITLLNYYPIVWGWKKFKIH